MKNRHRIPWLMAAVAATGVAGAVMAQTGSGPDSAVSGPGNAAPGPDDAGAGAGPGAGPGTEVPMRPHWHHRHMMLSAGLLRAFHQLNLTPQQRQSVKSIVAAARQQAEAQRRAAGAPDFTVLSNPGDANYAAALQALQARIAQRIEQASQTELQLYNVLTPEQKARLPQVLADIKARKAQRAAGPA